MSAATMNEMERLRRERDEARTERDALAAHLHQIRHVFNRYDLADYCSDEEIAAESELYDLMEQDPATSLARLKAQWAQEGARAAAQAIRMDYEGAIHADDIADFVDEIADDYRRQAEEVNDENAR